MNKMKEEKMGKARIGVFSVGYDKYWSQFPGLLDELLKKEAEFIRKIPVEEVEVFSFGMVDSPAKKTAPDGHQRKGEGDRCCESGFPVL